VLLYAQPPGHLAVQAKIGNSGKDVGGKNCIEGAKAGRTAPTGPLPRPNANADIGPRSSALHGTLLRHPIPGDDRAFAEEFLSALPEHVLKLLRPDNQISYSRAAAVASAGTMRRDGGRVMRTRVPAWTDAIYCQRSAIQRALEAGGVSFLFHDEGKAPRPIKSRSAGRELASPRDVAPGGYRFLS
jgi:hypothetical protein